MTLKNIDNSCIITVENKQTIDGVKDTITETANCSYSIRNGKYYILYKNENSSTSIIYDGKMLSIRRKGDIQSNMHFIKGEITSSLYIMPYGKAPIRIETTDMYVDLNERGGCIKIKYTLDFNNDKYYNDMCIRIA